MYRYFNVSPCYAMEDAQRRDIRGRAEARVTAFRRARNPFSPYRGIKFFSIRVLEAEEVWRDGSIL